MYKRQGQNIKKLRIAKDISQEKLAELALSICPIAPICPIPDIGKNSYKGGYNTGFRAGMRAARE